MLATNWEKIDRFYLLSLFLVFLMVLLLIFSLQRIFSGFRRISQISEVQEIRIDEEMLGEAYSWVFEKKEVPLEIR